MLDPAFVNFTPKNISLFVPYFNIFQNYLLKVLILLFMLYIQTANLISNIGMFVLQNTMQGCCPSQSEF